MSRPSPARSTTSSSLKGKNSTDDISLKDVMYQLYSLMTIHSEIQSVKWLYLLYILLFLYVAAEDQNDIFITTQRQ